ncbi:MAG: hypothetical protein JXB49_31110 [Bacteroidales bacterium]|nr:hypothetical protein [Bacteroidales bacterium]MBN2820710.1 hypothetical protein [Bacteroidales bacterium]
MAINHRQIKEALLIRYVEESFLNLFSRGKLNGTVHTCVGEELSAVAFAGQLKKQDFVFSNHRCHGHYISFTKDCKGLIGELMGKGKGICGGIGSSQHLQNGNFYSNGIQGGIVPMAAGHALANKLRGNGNIGVVYIGDGTLGEGALYETMNIISLWELPLLIVCENNGYAQSTEQKDNLAGNIVDRAKAFGIKTFDSDVWDENKLLENASESIEYIRKNQKPAFHLVNLYRLNAHSKGDDDRDVSEVNKYRERDFINKFSKNEPHLYNEYMEPIIKKVDNIIADFDGQDELDLKEYYSDNLVVSEEKTWTELQNIKQRQVNLMNQFFDNALKNKEVVFIGEDVKSPYGGAFKVAKNLSFNFPQQVLTTPISEGAITGIANGLALAGFKPFVEIMFGDFVTLAFDQIVNHASKIHHMYNKKVSCPMVLRTPMGGGRGYGPTHSQSLERFLLGIDNVKLLAINTFINPEIIFNNVLKEKHPTIIIENKTDYGKYIGPPQITNYKFIANNEEYPTVKALPVLSQPNLTIVTYGGVAHHVINSIEKLFLEYEFKAEVIILTKLHPIDYLDIVSSVETTRKLVTVEEGSIDGGIGSEIISNVVSKIPYYVSTLRIGSLPIPIPSAKSLEEQVLPTSNSIVNSIKRHFYEANS